MSIIAFLFALFSGFSTIWLLWRFSRLNQQFFRPHTPFFADAGVRPYNLQRDTSFSQHIIRHSAVCENAMRTNHV